MMRWAMISTYVDIFSCWLQDLYFFFCLAYEYAPLIRNDELGIENRGTVAAQLV